VKSSREGIVQVLNPVNIVSQANPKLTNSGDGEIDRARHCVFAVVLPGCGMETNWVACKTPMPMGVGAETR
jgi:hypothetical protein